MYLNIRSQQQPNQRTKISQKVRGNTTYNIAKTDYRKLIGETELVADAIKQIYDRS